MRRHRVRTRHLVPFLLIMLVPCASAQQALPDPLTLEAALALADAPHPDLELAAARLDAARAGREQAGVRDALEIGLEARLQAIEPSSVAGNQAHNDSSARLYLRKRLYDFGQTPALRDAAEQRLSAQTWGYLASRQQRRLDIMQRYFDVLVADHAYVRDNEAMSIAFVAFDRAQDRNELGQLSDVELLRLESEFQASRSQWARSQGQQLATRNRLALALNRPDDLPANLVPPAEPDWQQPLADVDALTSRVLAANPALAELRARVKAAEQDLTASKAGGRPVLSAEVEAAAYNRKLGSSNPLEAGLVLEWPLLDGGRSSAEVAASRAELRRLRAELAREELTLRQQVLDLHLQLDQSRVELERLAVLADYRDLYLDRSRALYEMEVQADLGDAMVQTSSVRYQHAKALYDWMLAKARLDALAGELPGETIATREDAAK